jgi:hypothetical protein
MIMPHMLGTPIAAGHEGGRLLESDTFVAAADVKASITARSPRISVTARP